MSCYKCLVVTANFKDFIDYIHESMGGTSEGVADMCGIVPMATFYYRDGNGEIEEIDTVILIDDVTLSELSIGLPKYTSKMDTVEFYGATTIASIGQIDKERIEILFRKNVDDEKELRMKKLLDDCFACEGCWECTHNGKCDKELRGK